MSFFFYYCSSQLTFHIAVYKVFCYASTVQPLLVVSCKMDLQKTFFVMKDVSRIISDKVAIEYISNIYFITIKYVINMTDI